MPSKKVAQSDEKLLWSLANTTSLSIVVTTFPTDSGSCLF